VALLQRIWDRINEEPALVGGLVQAVIVLGVSFGLELTPEQQGAILGLTAILVALLVRQRVTPV
jgi:hypothetical protein